MSSINRPVQQNAPENRKPELPKTKISAFSWLKSSIKQRHKPPPVVFPPPSWELDDNAVSNETIQEVHETPIDPPEPLSFANSLKSLIESVTAQGSLTTSTVHPPEGQGTTNENGKETASPQPVPSGLDIDLVRMLSSEAVMNGSRTTSTSGRRTSIWNILSELKNGNGNYKEVASASHVSKVEEGEDGLMMYAPLEPEPDSQVELATPESVLTVDESSKVKPAGPQTEDSNSTKPTKEVKAVEKHIWVPSTTSLSVLTTWWGYRIYLPPPVMAKLDNKTLKATARAAIITASLKWLLDKIPLTLIPPQFRLAVKLLKQLSPLTGYIGVFIAWSWDRVRSLDEGNGVVLTATWVLPVALLPMTWDAGDIFRPILPPKPEELAEIQEAEKAQRNTSPGQSAQMGERKKSLFRW